MVLWMMTWGEMPLFSLLLIFDQSQLFPHTGDYDFEHTKQTYTVSFFC